MENVSLKLSTFIALLVLLAGVVGGHYKGMADSKDYTDKKVEQVQKDIKNDQKITQQKVDELQIALAVVKQILIQQYGDPNLNKNGKK
jgi:hypothetical protein